MEPLVLFLEWFFWICKTFSFIFCFLKKIEVGFGLKQGQEHSEPCGGEPSFCYINITLDSYKNIIHVALSVA
jgi:hypothetical protein